MAVDVEVGSDLVVITLTGKDRLFALKGSLKIPTEKIRSVEVLPKREVSPGRGLMMRLPGTYVPAVVQHGSYGFGANREFWAVYRHDDVLVISVDDWTYRKSCPRNRQSSDGRHETQPVRRIVSSAAHGARLLPATAFFKSGVSARAHRGSSTARLPMI